MPWFDELSVVLKFHRDKGFTPFNSSLITFPHVSFIFICGIFNDVVTSFPIGLSSLNYLLICVVATYIRNITLRPIFINDWLFFLVTILLVNSINFLVLEIVMNIDINFNVYITNLGFTFLFYPAFYGLFKSLIKFLY